MGKLIGILLLFLPVVAQAITSNQQSFGYFDLLLWQVRESSAENWAQLIPPAGTQVAIQLVDAPFDWNTGYRVGVGRKLNQNNDDITLAFTHFQTQATNQTSGIVYSAFIGNYFANNTNGANFGPSYNNANIRWQFFYNSFDANLSHEFKIDSILELHSYVGIKTAAINQHIYTNWLNPTNTSNFTAATENIKNDFLGVGPTIGANSTWPFLKRQNQSFDLIGNIGIGLLWGHWSFKEVYANNAPTTITVTVNSVNGAAPVANGFIGLQWSQQLPRMDMYVRLGYEAQAWFNQMQFYSYNMGRLNRTTWLQGGDLECHISF